MKIFINDIPFRIIPFTKEIKYQDYDHIIVQADDKIDFNLFHDDVLIQHASIKIIDRYLQLLKSHKNKKIDSITFQVENFEDTIKYFKSEYTIVLAAGGLIIKNGHFLLIYRLGKWDLPKGKIDEQEKEESAAIREVKEECGITARIVEKVCHTWHTYKRNNDNILKKTIWYQMECVDDSMMAPQQEENIEEIRWMNQKELNLALYNSYPSIRHVFRKYFRNKENQIL